MSYFLFEDREEEFNLVITRVRCGKLHDGIS